MNLKPVTKLVTDLDFLIDSSQLMVNAHQNWAQMIEKDVEEPLVNLMNVIPLKAKVKF